MLAFVLTIILILAAFYCGKAYGRISVEIEIEKMHKNVEIQPEVQNEQEIVVQVDEFERNFLKTPPINEIKHSISHFSSEKIDLPLRFRFI